MTQHERHDRPQRKKRPTTQAKDAARRTPNCELSALEAKLEDLLRWRLKVRGWRKHLFLRHVESLHHESCGIGSGAR